MDDTLHKARRIHKLGCVSIIMNSHRSSPENRQDGIRLKNLIAEADKRLLKQVNRELALNVSKNLHELANSIDHNKNLDSLILFANEDYMTYTTLPLSVEDRVVVDKTFATRDLIRALRKEATYYLLILSRQEARLVKAQNDRLVMEFKGKFPMKNEVFTTDPLKLSMSKGQDHMIEEFFNRVDKEVQHRAKNASLPIVLVTEKRNGDHFLKVADHKEGYRIQLTGNHSKESGKDVILKAWPLVKEYLDSLEKEKVGMLQQAISKGNVLSDMDEVWQAIQSRKGHLLFVDKNYFSKAFAEEGSIRPIKGKAVGTHVIEDVVDEMIESILEKGGDAVFVDPDQLNDYKNLVLVTKA